MREYRKTEKSKVYRKRYMKKYYKNHKDNWHSYRPEKRLQLRQLIFNHYGNMCACCGETESLFLSIDHVNNDGASERRSKKDGKRLTGINFYIQIVKENFPDRYQILCMNCNFGKYRNGGVCPHETLKQELK